VAVQEQTQRLVLLRRQKRLHRADAGFGERLGGLHAGEQDLRRGRLALRRGERVQQLVGERPGLRRRTTGTLEDAVAELAGVGRDALIPQVFPRPQGDRGPDGVDLHPVGPQLAGNLGDMDQPAAEHLAVGELDVDGEPADLQGRAVVGNDHLGLPDLHVPKPERAVPEVQALTDSHVAGGLQHIRPGE
jgi:hypothetical protein